jgi:hypothetical protein
MDDSEIFNEYVKIASAQGLIKTAAKDDKPKETKTLKTKRYDSRTDDAIRLLYGIEPEDIFNGKDDETIIDAAHPDTVSVGRSYDAMNSIVENLHQRHDIMTWVATKMPTGHLTQKRYVAAKQELLNTLVRSGFLLDNHDEHELMSLADSCANRLSKGKKIEKIAIPVLVPAAIAAVVGAAYYFGYGATTATNVYDNCGKVLDALGGLEDKVYYQSIYDHVSALMENAERFYELQDQIIAEESNLDYTQDPQSVAQKPVAKAAATFMEAYKKQLNNVRVLIPRWTSRIERVHSRSAERTSEWWSRLSDATDPLFWSKDETLIDRLAGQGNWMGGGSTGGLLESVNEEVRVISGALSQGHAMAQQKLDEARGGGQVSAPAVQEEPAPVRAPSQTHPSQALSAPAEIPHSMSGPAARAPGAFVPPTDPTAVFESQMQTAASLINRK